ncbi:uncharacterized protein LOC114364466 [Ostrinia furnacalis]|uniref:uncharacterized protein LOC114364466 n=1 Tax=Ostrinia furnacalis TaxID=93504 RepID=UPI00103E55C3|nr:uncharacterized protein LOC114364466 [Ostrinia furnacalis]
MSSSVIPGSHSQPEFFRCTTCNDNKLYKGKRGLNIHNTRCHKNSSLPAPPPSNPQNTPHPSFESFITHLHNSIRVVKRIPRGARISLAKSLTSVIEKCLLNTSENWQNLFTFSYSHLHVSPSSKSLTRALIENSSHNPNPLLLPPFPLRSSANIYRTVESKVMDGDLKNAARILFSDDTLAPPNQETLKSLQEKHPSRPIPPSPVCLPPPLNYQPLQIVDDSDTLAAIMSFPPGSAGGIDGITPQHLKDLVSVSAADAGRTLLSNITKLCNLLLSGKVVDNFSPFLYGARLCAFRKKDGGIRPIAIGSTFRRLAA